MGPGALIALGLGALAVNSVAKAIGEPLGRKTYRAIKRKVQGRKKRAR